MKHLSRKKSSFTLMELLVVMLLMGIMIGVATPSFTSIARGRVLSLAAMEISGQISIARSHALQNHTQVALIFPTMSELQRIKGKNEVDKTYLTRYYNACCRAAIVHQSGGKLQFVMWLPDSEWILLPEGTAIPEHGKNFPSFPGQLYGVHVGNLMRALKVGFGGSAGYGQYEKVTDSDKTINVERYLLFKPNGELERPPGQGTGNKKIIIRVTNGSFDKVKRKFLLKKRTKTEQMYLKVKISPMTGKTTLESEPEKTS